MRPFLISSPEDALMGTGQGTEQANVCLNVGEISRPFISQPISLSPYPPTTHSSSVRLSVCLLLRPSTDICTHPSTHQSIIHIFIHLFGVSICWAPLGDMFCVGHRHHSDEIPSSVLKELVVWRGRGVWALGEPEIPEAGMSSLHPFWKEPWSPNTDVRFVMEDMFTKPFASTQHSSHHNK